MAQKRTKSKSANPFLENADHMGEMTVRQLVELVSTPEFAMRGTTRRGSQLRRFATYAIMCDLCDT